MANDHLELTTPNDLYYDYCLWQYGPIAPPEGKLRSANLLYDSFEKAGAPESAYDLVGALRQGIGMSNTVWGVKHVDGQLRWEFYFYDYRRQARERSISTVLRIMHPFIRCAVPANERLNYFMFSLDVNNELLAGSKELGEVHMYIGNTGSTVSSGICYSLTVGGTRLENLYYFFDAKAEQDKIKSKITTSAFVDMTAVHMDRLLWPELKDCAVIVVANKQQNDALYFSRINIDQLLFFLKRMEYPSAHVAFVETNRSRLDHLLYDVGIDYRMEGGDLRILKSGYYGIF
jgi:hypothetical protein